MTHVDLRTIRLRSGEQYEDTLAVELEPLTLGGERYVPVPESAEAGLTVTRAASGTVFRLRLEPRLAGPCMRCLGDAVVTLRLDVTEYQASSPASDDERTPYLDGDRLDLSAWARDAIVLALPEKILCAEDCAGLCAGCGADLNRDACTCAPPEPDPRLAKLRELL